MATLVALQERRPGHTDGLSPHYSGGSRHCRAAPAHHAATQWFLLTFPFLPKCAGQAPFFFFLSFFFPRRPLIWPFGSNAASLDVYHRQYWGKKHSPDLHFSSDPSPISCFLLLPLPQNQKGPSLPLNFGIRLAFCWLICPDRFFPPVLVNALKRL